MGCNIRSGLSPLSFRRQKVEDDVIRRYTLYYEALINLAFVKRNFGIYFKLELLKLRP